MDYPICKLQNLICLSSYFFNNNKWLLTQELLLQFNIYFRKHNCVYLLYALHFIVTAIYLVGASIMFHLGNNIPKSREIWTISGWQQSYRENSVWCQLDNIYMFVQFSTAITFLRPTRFNSALLINPRFVHMQRKIITITKPNALFRNGNCEVS